MITQNSTIRLIDDESITLNNDRIQYVVRGGEFIELYYASRLICLTYPGSKIARYKYPTIYTVIDKDTFDLI
jgi:hypothetical protein